MPSIYLKSLSKLYILTYSLMYSMDIIKPKNDKCEYKHIKLANGPDAILIYDQKSISTYFAISFHVGFRDDPHDLIGVTHYLEHILHFGSTEYEDISKYDEYCSDNGGEINATTLQSTTTFYFYVESDAFEEGL